MGIVMFGSKGSVSQVPLPSLQPFLSPPPPTGNHTEHTIDDKISPSILLIIIILAVIFFISGLLHLLVRFLIKPSRRAPDDLDNVTALQGQLQQLFHLHDAGVDQSFIDTLPVFLYKAIIGLKNPFDCAVCLCEFEEDDKLRLLPKCSHAFHLDCIDTWLLSHSTCPLCRGSLLPDFSANCSPVVLVLESGSVSSREFVTNCDLAGETAPQMGFHREDEFGSARTEVSQKPGEIPAREVPVPEAKVVPVKLGKFRNVDVAAGGAESSSSNVDARRCFSMGSFEYILDNTSVLRVAIAPTIRNQASKKSQLPLTPGHRPAMSECDFSKNSSNCKNGHTHNRRESFKGFDSVITGSEDGTGAASIQKSKTESFSISKIWLRSKKNNEKAVDSSRRALSFRLPFNQEGGGGDDLKMKQGSDRMSVSETEVTVWENHSNICSCSCPKSEFGFDEEEQNGGFNSFESQSKTPSFARRTLNWLVGRQNKVVHSSNTAPV